MDSSSAALPLATGFSNGSGHPIRRPRALQFASSSTTTSTTTTPTSTPTPSTPSSSSTTPLCQPAAE
ncbi:hypothetical protein ZHAS_00007756 [Anopheles sinensis]|uniref:Uncharacterized protein n=1 Tax=Anopheles sinensis TaxID=74873 RepID=A0A084VQN0_ANOSI|nr:hypothetical protein ZHAS_00007756 [Anopheles sinensis]